jgi:hypothetical protein
MLRSGWMAGSKILYHHSLTSVIQNNFFSEINWQKEQGYFPY